LSNPFTSEEPPHTLTVSELNRQARVLLESHFDYIWVEGEVSNFVVPGSGHWYFSLKDGNAQVRCAMFRNRNQRARFTPGNGDAVRLRCRVSLYEGRGEFQLIVEHLEHAGAGALQAAFEKLKARLLAEGLFNPERKKPLPETVSHLGVVTSPTGAAIHDILTVLERRFPAIRVSILPVAVQGEGAAREIADAIANANRWQKEGKLALDALIVGRGGGSLEDLWAFNEEIVARAIADSDLPIVSAVGHEVDFTIADMAADHRAPTPSAAAELLSPDQREWEQRLKQLEDNLVRLMQGRLATAAAELEHLGKRLKHPGARLREQAQRLDDLEQRLVLAQRNQLHRRRSELSLLESRLRAASPQPRLQQLLQDTVQLQRRMESAIGQRIRHARERLAHLAEMLHSLSPLATLQRGYAVITDSEGRVVSDAGTVEPGDRVKARLSKGHLDLTVDRVAKDS
jgi:exodeoxyribonuclease VII large subunit